MNALSRSRMAPAQLRRLIGSQQVAAVCYRIRQREIEFLLVKSRGGRWTFPKGGAEPGLTHAQAAALEAFEEAGVHGRIEEKAFSRYVRRPAGRKKSRARDILVDAHLCEVMRLEDPQEYGRNPTWFSPDKAKRKLIQHRSSTLGSEFARVVDQAVARIFASRKEPSPPAALNPRDGLQKAPFEAAEIAGFGHMPRAAYVRYSRRVITVTQSPEAEPACVGKAPRILSRRPLAGNAPFLVGNSSTRPAEAARLLPAEPRGKR
jgi:8-oxo-dGTP pyrophosphatase MutT (NUDIX family)